MLATFSLRLAFGLAASLLVLSPAQVAPRFYRVQFLIILGLLALAAFFLFAGAGICLLMLLAAGLVFSFLGSVVWMLEGAPAGRLLIGLTLLTLLALPFAQRPDFEILGLLDDLTSALLLGTALSAMLMGHSYLVAPAMALTPLLRLLLALLVALLLRMAFAGLQLSSATGAAADAVLWLPVRWLVGFVGPLVLTIMAWRCARIRSTQSATGILYVVVVLCFFGELVGLLAYY